MDVQVLGPRARLRKPKFTPDQIKVLIERVVAHGPQLYGEKMSPVSVRKRIWQEVTQAINRISHTERSVIEVQKRWQDERRRIRHRAQDLWRALAETGVPMGHLTPLEEAVMSTFDEAAVKKTLEAGAGAEAGLGAAPPPQAPLPQKSLLEDLPVYHQPNPAPVLPTSMPVVYLQDIKQEPDESASPAGGGSEPQEWQFEWTTEEASVVSLQANSTLTAHKVPQLTAPQSPTDTAALHTSPANQTRPRVHSPHSIARRRKLRQQRLALDRAGCAGLTACLRRVASGTMGLQQELHALSNNVLALRSELGTLVSAVSAIASILQHSHGHHNTECHFPTPP